MKLFFLALFSTLFLNITAQDIEGTWKGALDINGIALKVVFNISESDGQLIATMDSPDQNAYGLATDSCTFENGNLIIKAEQIKFEFNGSLDETKKLLSGVFKQGTMSLPIVLNKNEAEETDSVNPRPQDPTSFDYKVEDVSFVNSKGGHSLAGTLTIPHNSFDKVVILISGSGAQNRDEEIPAFNHRPFLVLSDHLTRNGIAVLRYDDRGVGESGGKFSSSTSRDFADDTNAAVEFLKSRVEFKSKKIGLIGHSEGGMIAPMVANINNAVDFIVLLAGPGIDVIDLLRTQVEKVALSQGVSKEDINESSKISDLIYGYLKENKDYSKEEIKPGLRKILEKYIEELPQIQKAGIPDKEAFIKQQIKAVSNDWFLYFIRYEPSFELKKLTCPILAINGELDIQVTSKKNLAGINQVLKDSGHKNFTVKEIKGQNHMFQNAITGNVTEYKEIEETFNVGTMDYVTEWIQNIRF